MIEDSELKRFMDKMEGCAQATYVGVYIIAATLILILTLGVGLSMRYLLDLLGLK